MGERAHVEVATAAGSQLEELVALAWFYPEGLPPTGLHGVAVQGGVCRVFRDGVGEFTFAPLTDDTDAAPIYEAVGRPLDEPESPARQQALREYVRAVRGPVVDRLLVIPAERIAVKDGVASLKPRPPAPGRS